MLQQREKLKVERKTAEYKKKSKEEKKVLMDTFGFAIVDGYKEKVGNFRVEPPALFRGRGKHPKTGMIKASFQPSLCVRCVVLTLPLFLLRSAASSLRTSPSTSARACRFPSAPPATSGRVRSLYFPLHFPRVLGIDSEIAGVRYHPRPQGHVACLLARQHQRRLQIRLPGTRVGAWSFLLSPQFLFLLFSRPRALVSRARAT